MKKRNENKDTNWVQWAILVINLFLIGAVVWLYMEGSPRIAYVQTNYLLSNYQGFKDASMAYQQKSSVWKANIDTLASELDAMKADYEAEKSQLSSKEDDLTKELLRTRQQQLTQYREGIRQKAAQEDQAMTAKVVQEINAFLKEYGKKHNYKIIFGATDVGNIVYAEEAIDLTAEVLEALNRRYRGE